MELHGSTDCKGSSRGWAALSAHIFAFLPRDADVQAGARLPAKFLDMVFSWWVAGGFHNVLFL